MIGPGDCFSRADSRFAPSQWETALLCNDVSHWLGANLKSALFSPVQRQANIGSNAYLLLTLSNKLHWNFTKNTTFAFKCTWKYCLQGFKDFVEMSAKVSDIRLKCCLQSFRYCSNVVYKVSDILFKCCLQSFEYLFKCCLQSFRNFVQMLLAKF